MRDALAPRLQCSTRVATSTDFHHHEGRGTNLVPLEAQCSERFAAFLADGNAMVRVSARFCVGFGSEPISRLGWRTRISKTGISFRG